MIKKMWGDQSYWYSWRLVLLHPFSQPTSQSSNFLLIMERRKLVQLVAACATKRDLKQLMMR